MVRHKPIYSAMQAGKRLEISPIETSCLYYTSKVMRKTAFCICENKAVDQNRTADQHLCLRYTGNTIPLLPNIQASSHLLRLYSPVCVGPGRKP